MSETFEFEGFIDDMSEGTGDEGNVVSTWLMVGGRELIRVGDYNRGAQRGE